ncbi:MAG: chromosomal replication initiation protein DnaA [Chloroflexi bacterium RBG_16_48_8]|nr:MAG: chromosomal replication initiation protein DnaA [Chloroflexi bacterium RBG_16_48_8]
MNAERVWDAALGQLQLEMPRAIFDTWVRDAELLAYEDGTFIIGVQNAYARDWLEDRLRSTVSRVLTSVTGRSSTVRFVVWHGEVEEVHLGLETPAAMPVPIAANGNASKTLQTRYTFESFVVGPSNRLAEAACQAVAESPARSYNPLFLYGGVGLGKTHLLQAVGNATASSGLQVLYVSSEEFTNDLINAIRNHTTDAFRGRYRNIDVLLIDDIQFIAGKESTQEEFFHTFNTLHGQDKQLVISSDRPPKALVTLEERLRSRFEWGLTADIQPPDYETRLAILRTKAERLGRKLPFEFLETIARRIQSNIRELEGALNRVLAYSDLSGLPLTTDLVNSALADLLPKGGSLTSDDILKAVARYFGIDEDRLLGKQRSRDIALPRQIAMYLIREETGASLPQIGAFLGGRDHTTILYGYDKISDQLEIDDGLRRQVFSIKETLYNEAQIYV